MNQLKKIWMLSGQPVPDDLAAEIELGERNYQSTRGPSFDEFAAGPINSGEGYFTASDGSRMTFGRQVNDAPLAPRQEPQGGSVLRVFSDTGRDLGVSRETPDIDFSRNQISIPGRGKGYYSKDGSAAYIANPAGGYSKVLLGYDDVAADKAQDRALAIESKRTDIDATREQIARSQAERQRKEMPNAPAGYRWTPTGNLERIPGGPADEKAGAPKLTEDERRSAGLAVRMESALQAMNQFPNAAKPELDAAALSSVGLDTLANVFTSKERQQVEAAQLDALDAALTLATGAAYTKEQLKNLSKSYFPQIGDDPETVTAKQSKLAEVIDTARIRAGGAAKTIDEVVNKYRPQQGIPQGAVDMLRKNPSLAPQFDAKYGQGASAKVLR